MFKRILVPIAFSDYSEGIIRYAANLASKLDAELKIVNVVNERDLEAVERIASLGYHVDGNNYIDLVHRERLETLEKYVKGIAIKNEKVAFSFLTGEPTVELLKFVVTENIDLVVMGIKTKELWHLLAGSVAERMFRKCPATIVSYRDDQLAQQLKNRIIKNCHL